MDSVQRGTGSDQPNGHEFGTPGTSPQPFGPQPYGPPQSGAPFAAPPQQPPAPKGKRTVLLGVLVVVLVCAGLCGVGQLITNIINKDEWENLGEPVSAPAASLPATPEPTWQPPNEFTRAHRPVLKIRHQLESWVLRSAGLPKPVTSICDDEDFTGTQAATLTCTVTYEGQTVVYTVKAHPKDQYIFEWEATAEQTVVTREGLLARVYRQFVEGPGREWSNLRCEEFPEVALVPVGQALPQVCYAKHEDRLKTSKIIITPSDQGEPFITTEHQEEGLS